MGAATASSTAGTTLASQIFGPTVMLSGISAIAAAVMTHTGSFVFLMDYHMVRFFPCKCRCTEYGYQREA